MTTYLLLRSNQIQLHWRPVWPDWAIFFYFLAIHFLVKVAQISGDFLATLKASLLKGKLLWLLLSNLFGAIWLLCSLTSGQTVGDQPIVTRLGNLLTFGLRFTVCSNNAQIFRNFLNIGKNISHLYDFCSENFLGNCLKTFLLTLSDFLLKPTGHTGDKPHSNNFSH